MTTDKKDEASMRLILRAAREGMLKGKSQRETLEVVKDIRATQAAIDSPPPAEAPPSGPDEDQTDLDAPPSQD